MALWMWWNTYRSPAEVFSYPPPTRLCWLYSNITDVRFTRLSHTQPTTTAAYTCAPQPTPALRDHFPTGSVCQLSKWMWEYDITGNVWRRMRSQIEEKMTFGCGCVRNFYFLIVQASFTLVAVDKFTEELTLELDQHSSVIAGLYSFFLFI